MMPENSATTVFTNLPSQAPEIPYIMEMDDFILKLNSQNN